MERRVDIRTFVYSICRSHLVESSQELKSRKSRRKKKEGVRERKRFKTHSAADLVWTQAAQNNHLLEHSKVVPLAGQTVSLGLHTVIVVLPLLHQTRKRHSNAFKPAQFTTAK